MAIVTRRYVWTGANLAAIQNNADPGASLAALAYQAQCDVTFNDAIADASVVDAQMQSFGFTFQTATPTGAPRMTLDTDGNAITNAMSPYTIKSTDVFLFVDTSGGPVTLVLPDPTSFTYSKQFNIVDKKGTFSTNFCTLAPFAAEKIEGLAASKAFQTAWGGWTIVTDQVDWYTF